MDFKDTNPKDAIGVKKSPISCMSAPVKHMVGLAMLEGAIKYGRHNYRVAGVRHSVYYDAINRHLDAWWEGQDIDPDSQLHHLVKVAACCFVMMDSILAGNDVDDRPPALHEGFMKDMNKKAEEMLARLPEAKPAYTEKEAMVKVHVMGDTIDGPPRAPVMMKGNVVEDYLKDCSKREAKDDDKPDA
jgi:hypothetical protein